MGFGGGEIQSRVQSVHWRVRSEAASREHPVESRCRRHRGLCTYEATENEARSEGRYSSEGENVHRRRKVTALTTYFYFTPAPAILPSEANAGVLPYRVNRVIINQQFPAFLGKM